MVAPELSRSCRDRNRTRVDALRTFHVFQSSSCIYRKSNHKEDSDNNRDKVVHYLYS
jgi:hypothetical protein